VSQINTFNFSKIIKKQAISLVEQDFVPDFFIRMGIRHLITERLSEIRSNDIATAALLTNQFIEEIKEASIAILTNKANEQHYEIPADFFAGVLGSHRKYSSCYWPDNINHLDDAEAASLQATCEHAKLSDKQEILELGCGWGSLTLWMAKQYPQSNITAVSNSNSQRLYIQAEAARRNLTNIRIITCDMNTFEINEKFDRVISVEMFEHMRNWFEMFKRVNIWLKPDGLFFMHVFVHKLTPYFFIERDSSDWMSRYFFSGGMMPSDDLALHFQDHLKLLERWRWDGTHYARTANAWLINMDAKRDSLWPIIAQTYGEHQTKLWWVRWRIFFMSCAELFGYKNGQEWWVTHYLFKPRL
jgi:cyclopropane-fatty-acyl-phospholipid synthase